MGLFDKKYCDICGEKIGLFGNRKLEDGNMCKHCAKKLSPWFDDRRHSTLEEIKDQLAYREQNQKNLQDFKPTWQAGDKWMVYVDEDAGTFIVTKGSADAWQEENPDLFQLDEVKECSLDVDENRRELYYTDRDGNDVSYNPRRYEYSYNFKMTITLDHPFVDEVKFNLNDWESLKIEYADRSFFGTGTFNPERDSEYRHYLDAADAIIDMLTGEDEYEEEEDADVYEDEQGNSFQVVTCPYCGARSRMTYNGKCENCGGNLEG